MPVKVERQLELGISASLKTPILLDAKLTGKESRNLACLNALLVV